MVQVLFLLQLWAFPSLSLSFGKFVLQLGLVLLQLRNDDGAQQWVEGSSLQKMHTLGTWLGQRQKLDKREQQHRQGVLEQLRMLDKQGQQGQLREQEQGQAQLLELGQVQQLELGQVQQLHKKHRVSR